MNYYVTVILTAKSSINDICHLVLICNENSKEQCGIRKIITPDFPYYKYIFDSLSAQSTNIIWKPDTCIPYILSYPIFIGEGCIEIKQIPQIKTLTNNLTQLVEHNSVLSLLINGVFEKNWENDFFLNYNLNSYSLKLFGNFTYGNVAYNVNVINNCLRQMKVDFDEKYNNYINAPIYKQSKYAIEIKGHDKEGLSVIVYPEIEVQIKIDCDFIEGFKWGLSIVQKNGLKGIIDIRGKFILPCVYKEILPLKLFRWDEETFGDFEMTEEYDRFSGNSIHTFIQNQDGLWANVTISTIDDCHWDTDCFYFKFDKLFYLEGEKYAVALIGRKYADFADIPIEYLDADFDFLYRLALVFFNGECFDYHGIAIDDIVNVLDGGYIIAKKYTFFEPKIGLFKIEKLKYHYPNETIKQILNMTDDFKTIEYVGSNMFAITFHDVYTIECYLEYDLSSCCKLNDFDPSYEYMALYHLKDGFLSPPILPTSCTYRNVEGDYLPIFSCYDKDKDFGKWYYDEKTCNWEEWIEEDDSMYYNDF